jgi:dihydroorotase
MGRLFRNVHLVDPAAGRNGIFDLLIDGDRVVRIEPNLPADGAEVVELPSSFIVTPGLIDLHVHLREPGQEHKETIATGTASAVAGGFTAVAGMPNTSPINDHASVTEFIVKRAKDAGLARVYPIGAVSIGSKGQALTEIGDLRSAGCVAISDDGRPIETALLMRRALEYASMFDMPVIDHCEDPSLRGDGVAHEGAAAARLGLRGIPGVAESIMVERDISLAELTGGRFHVAHMSARQSLRAVRDGKARGVQVTTEVTPHHFVLSDDVLTDRGDYDTNFKMNPPLREEADRLAMIEGIRDGSIDAIATDHAPHHPDEKALEFDHAPFGIVGLETAVPLCFDRLVHAGVIGLSRLIELLTAGPARALSLPGGTLREGGVADLTILAPDAPVTVRASTFRSKSRNTPFDGWTLKGAVAATIVGGRVVYVNADVLGRKTL